MKRRQKMIYSSNPIYSSLESVKEESAGGHNKPVLPCEVKNSPYIQPSEPNPVSETDFPSGPPPEAADSVPEPLSEAVFPPPVAVIKLSADSYDFGQVFLGKHEDRVITIQNAGDKESIIEDWEGLPANGFSLIDPPATPLTIPGENSLDLGVRFAPETTGLKTAWLSIVAQGTDSKLAKAYLRGAAVGLVRTADAEYYSPVFNSQGMSFVYIPPGSFTRGSPEHEPGRNDDETPHKVRLTKGFYMQTTPVTRWMWQGLMGTDPSSFSASADDSPVEQISWIDCQKFLKKLNSLGEGTYRLPTEAEWEYACRAGSATAFALGEITSLFCEADPILQDLGWCCGNSDRTTHPVAQKEPNPWGLYDMHGNVCEWCLDWYGEYSTTSKKDPTGPKSGTNKVIRGGSWLSSAKNCRSASRFYWAPTEKAPFIGFRLIREL
jgi:formylglycine-generating enzyme required for sulfatase activity